jgi:hypothetical protein
MIDSLQNSFKIPELRRRIISILREEKVEAHAKILTFSELVTNANMARLYNGYCFI